jgi:hypothetical protein
MAPISRRNLSACPGSPVISTLLSGLPKMKAARSRAVAVIVTSAGAAGAFALSDHPWASPSAR